MTPVEALRAAVLATVLLGQGAAALAGVLPWPALPVALGLTAAGAHLSSGADPPRAVRLRRAATVLAAVLALAVLPRALGADDPRTLLGPLLVGVAAVQSLVWTTRRDLQGGLLSGLGLLVLGASYAPDVLVGLPLLAGWVTALVAGVQVGRARTVEGADLALPVAGRSPGVLPAAALAGVLGLVAFLLVPAPQDAGLQSRLAASAAGGTGPTRAALGAAIYSGRVDLRTRGDLGDRPLLEVDDGASELWRGNVLDTWDGRAWTASDARLAVVPGPPFVLDDAAPTRVDDVRVLGPSDGTLVAPGVPVGVELRGPGRVLVTGDGALRADRAVDYAVGSVVLPRPAPVRAGTDVDDPRWLQLPSSISPRTRALSRELTAGLDRPAAVASVEDWLRRNNTYRTDSPVPERGEDAVERFLHVDRTGFCEQFAAAGTVLLRAAGIPARFVSGVAYGVPSGQGRRTFREQDLHTWVEVFHPGVGWVASDPTAGAPRAGGVVASVRARLAAPLAAGLRAAEGVPGGRPALAAALLLATATGGVLTARRSRRPGRGRAADRPAGPALVAFLRWDDAQGPRRRRREETLGQVRARADPSLGPALEVVEREVYGSAPPDGAELAAAVRALEGDRRGP